MPLNTRKKLEKGAPCFFDMEKIFKKGAIFMCTILRMENVGESKDVVLFYGVVIGCGSSYYYSHIKDTGEIVYKSAIFKE